MQRRFFFLVLWTLLAPVVWADEPPVQVAVAVTPVGDFKITAPRIEGQGKKSGDTFTAKELKVAVDSLKTGMSLRDTHLHEKLESKKYKYIVVSNVVAKNGKGTAKITVRDVIKDVPFTYEDAGKNKEKAKFKLNLKEFGLSGISYKSVGVEDEVEVTATVAYQ
jgi:polyisoprenoid-binding protein YceI